MPPPPPLCQPTVSLAHHLFLTRLPFRALRSFFRPSPPLPDGYSIEELCPVTGTVRPEIRGKAKHLLRGSIFGSSSQKVPANRYVNAGYAIAMGAPSSSSTSSNPTGTESAADAAQTGESSSENCMWPNALQVSRNCSKNLSHLQQKLQAGKLLQAAEAEILIDPLKTPQKNSRKFHIFILIIKRNEKTNEDGKNNR